MSLLEIIVLAIIQGITEFLPISSSGHLVLPSVLLGWENDLAFDIAVHVGSLLAVMIYFRRDISEMLWAWTNSVVKGQHNHQSNLAWWIIIATLPVVVVGYAIKPYIEIYARSELVIASTTILFGLLLWYADAKSTQLNNLQLLGWKKALIIGSSQILALIPGTSRSGITMTTGLMLGLNREAAARFSFLLSIPTILGAGVLATKDLIDAEQAVNWQQLLLGSTLSFISAYACIFLFLSWISRIGMLPFVIYRLLLGAVLFIFVLYTAG